MGGSPKSCYFGDVQRGRISSQCLKRNIRHSEYLKDSLGYNTIGSRTRRTDILVFEELAKRGDYAAYHTDINKLLNTLGKGTEKEEKSEGKELKGSKTMQLYSSADIIKICDIIVEGINEGKKIKDIKLETILEKDFNIRPITLDIALFGRMAATKSFSTIEGSMQVSHAISTNKLKLENDYFTAVDDIVQREVGESGSGHLGDFEFNSSCFYQYYNIDVDKLFSNLENTEKSEDVLYGILKPLIEAICLENPTGKQNSFAAFSVPALVMIEVKDKKIPINYMNAFITPVKNNEKGNIVENSVLALSEYVNTVDKVYCLDKNRYWLNINGKEDVQPKNCEVVSDLSDLIDKVITKVKEV
jgi:CRISPR system Cascade subunit CasC